MCTDLSPKAKIPSKTSLKEDLLDIFWNTLRKEALRAFQNTPFHSWTPHFSIPFSFLKDFIYLFLERGEGRNRRRETSMLPLALAPTGDPACNPGMCPDWESSWRLFGSQVGTQPTDPHQPRWAFLKLWWGTWNTQTSSWGVRHLYKIGKFFFSFGWQSKKN